MDYDEQTVFEQESGPQGEKQMSGLAIITARGGSKRIPRKNIKPFLGRPIIEYSIEAALRCGCFDEVMVSTDDEEIAEIARKAGASVPFMRSEKTANDFATTADVLLEVLEEYEKRGKTFDYMACLYPTNPFITPEKLKDAMDIIQTENCDEVIPVVPFSYPPQRGFITNADGELQYKWEQFRNARSQDLEKMYHDAGQFYFFHVASFTKNKGKAEHLRPIVFPEDEVQDIDTEEDWRMAELKVRMMREIQ